MPYDELVDALANWRVKQGMSTRPATGRYTDTRDDMHQAVPENDFKRDEDSEDLEQYVVEGEED